MHKKNILSLIFVFDNVNLETLNILYLINQNYSFIKLRNVNKNKVQNDFESNYQLSSSHSKLHLSTLGLLVGVNPRYEGYLLNLSLRQRFLKGNFKLLSVGPILELTVAVHSLGSNLSVLKSIAEGNNFACQDIKNADYPLLITNLEFFKRSDSGFLNSLFKYINILESSWNGFNILNPSLGSNGTNSLNKFLQLSNDDLVSFFSLYSINVSLNSISHIKSLTELYLLKNLGTENGFKSPHFISQSPDSVNDFFFGKMKGKIINSYLHLPSSKVYEDNETYFNTQGLVKRMSRLLHFHKDAKPNWQILRKLYSNLNSMTLFNNKKDNQLVQFDCINSFNFKNYVSFHYFGTPSLTSLSFYLINQNLPIKKNFEGNFKINKYKIFNTKIKHWLDDFFNTNGRDSFSYSSSVIADCSKVLRSSSTNFF